MASARQIQAAKRNVKKARAAARRKRTIARLPKSKGRYHGREKEVAARTAMKQHKEKAHSEGR
jgi:hypothetical protein